mgnify:CR=1 FL=1
MSVVKAQTMQQRFGFQDKELTTPKHDEIMLWLDGWLDMNIGAVVGETCTQWDYVLVVPLYGANTRRSLNEFSSAELPEFPKPKINKKIWECPVTDRNYTIGFIDMKVSYWIPGELYFYPEEKRFQAGVKEISSYFEVKPSIPSLGEVIRQIRMYQTYTSGRWFVVSPDAKFKAQLLAQGIGFVEVNQ